MNFLFFTYNNKKNLMGFGYKFVKRKERFKSLRYDNKLANFVDEMTKAKIFFW